MKRWIATLLLFLSIFAFGSCEGSQNYLTLYYTDGSEPQKVLLTEASMLEEQLPVLPQRADGSNFTGWYYDLAFSKKADYYDVFSAKSLIAGYEVNYIFALVQGTPGCYGKEVDGEYEYFIPAGTYYVTMRTESEATIGGLSVFSNDGYVEGVGYTYLLKNYKFYPKERYEVTISDNQHVYLTVNSMFLFERKNVEEKYVDRRVYNNIPLFVSP